MFIFTGCNVDDNSELQDIAFTSLSEKEKAELVNKNDSAKIEKVDLDALPNNAKIFFGKHNEDEIYSVTFESKNQDLGNITIFVDGSSKETIGTLIRK